MTYECRLDAPPDPPIPPDPDPEPPHPTEPPDVDTPDFGIWIECGDLFHIPMLEQGPHHLEVRAIDNAENMDLTYARWEWEIDITVPDELGGDDTTPPDTFIAGGPLGHVLSTEATFRFTGSDNLIPGPYLTFQCRLDGAPAGDWAPCTTPAHVLGAPARRAHVRGRRGRPQGQRRPDAGRADVDDPAAADRRDASGHGDPLRARPDHGAHHRDVHVLERGPDRDVRVQAGRYVPA